MNNRLSGKVALITGGSRGIGRSITLSLAEAGADVAVIYSSDSEAALEVCALAQEKNVRTGSYLCNVADYESVRECVNSVCVDFGGIDILINNAGIIKDKLIMQMTESDYDLVLDVNLKGAFNMIHHSSRQFLKRKSGRIINISSVSGMMGNAGQSNYSASKAGLIGLTKTIAKEFASRNITCNAIAPGFIKTEMTAAYDASEMDCIPLKRMGETAEVAALAVFLASEAAGYITGEVIKIDGGLYI